LRAETLEKIGALNGLMGAGGFESNVNERDGKPHGLGNSE